MKHVSFLIKPASSLCNLACKYCFYHDVSSHRKIKNYGVMNEEVMKKLIDRAFEVVDDTGVITFQFQGGEPTLAGIDYFKSFIEYVNSKSHVQKINYSLQSNGILFDDEWIKFLKENEFLVGISLDGYESLHDYYRLDTLGKGTFSQVQKSIDLLKKYKVDFNILTVLTSNLAKYPSELYDFYKELNISYVQLIPCLSGVGEEENQDSLKPEEFKEFYIKLFSIWRDDLLKGNPIHISLFDNLAMILKRQRPMQCGMIGLCSPQLVVEANGDVYPCDFYVLDEYCCGNIFDYTIKEILESKQMSKFLSDDESIPNACNVCKYRKICNGGCKRQRNCYTDKKNNLCGYQGLLDEILVNMNQLLYF